MFDIKLIEKFRNTVNRTDFTFFQYRNKRNKNQWSCICSAMDWITVAVDHLNTYPEANVHALSSMVLYSYIASVDILVEAVQQLHRVICSNNKLPFAKDRDCFSNNPFGKADLDYFKETPQNTQKKKPCGKIPPGRAYIRHSISAADTLI